MFYRIKTPWIVKRMFSKLIWDIPNDQKNVYLTFDDGPTPMITKWVLDQLKQYDAKATFFCIGDNVQKFPNIYKDIVDQGHSIGNHTQNHLNGWQTSTSKYVQNIKNCFLNNSEHNPKLFRPPYGKIKMSQSLELHKMGFKIIMWDVLSADFDQTISKKKCFENVVTNVTSGSIIVFHDSKKAFQNLEYALPRTLQFLAANGYVSKAIGANRES